MNIDEMPAGRKLDVLVAKEVLGWTQVHQMNPGDFCGVPPQNVALYVLPNFSTDIEAAFQVVDRLLQAMGVMETISFEQLVYAYAEIVPLEACHVALKVVEDVGESRQGTELDVRRSG